MKCLQIAWRRVSGFTLFLVLTSFSCVSKTAAATEDFFFFPYTTCLRMKIEEDFPNEQFVILKGKVLESLRERIPISEYTKDGELGLLVHKPPAYVFGFKPNYSFTGREMVLAYNGDTRDGCGIRNMYDPFKGKAFSKEELEQFKNNLKKKSFFPFAACIQITVNDVKENKARKKLYLKTTINKAILANTKEEFRENRMPPKDHSYFANFKDGQMASFDIDCDFWLPYFSELKLDQIKGKSFLWSFNPLPSKSNVYRASSITAEPASACTNDKISEIKREVALLPKKMPALKSAVQANLEMRWPLERIRMYLKNPISLIPEKEKDALFGKGDNKFMLSGELYPERESEIGKIVWTANLFPDSYNRYSVKLIKNSKTYILDHDWISLVPLAPDEAEICLLKSVLNRIHSTYDCKRKDWISEYPNHLYGEIETNPSGKRVYKTFLNGTKELRASFNQDLMFTEIYINGKYDQEWNDALKSSNKHEPIYRTSSSEKKL